MELPEQDKREIIGLIENGGPIPDRLRAALCTHGAAADYGNEAIGLFSTDLASGKMLRCNLRAAQILGYADAEECRRKHDAPASYAKPQERERMLARLRDTGELRCYPVEILRPDGTTAHVRLWSRLDSGAGIADGAVDILPADLE
jgi:PAS domain-containing protein